jgi:hypothetical protein
MKYKFTSVIPVAQYANVQPEIEIEAESYEEAQTFVEPKINQLWDKYFNKPPSNETVRLVDFFENEIDYNEENHLYTWHGEKYLSGSEYAESFRKPFDKTKISTAMAKKHEVEASEIIAMWELNAQISRDFGNAIHGALQLEEQYRALGLSMDKSSVHKHPVLKTLVGGFVLAHTGEKAVSEVLVIDHQAKHAGRIDRLQITGPKRCRIQDFKTNADIKKDLEIYWKQLEFYADIVRANGWSVDGLDIYHFNGEWHNYTQGIPKGGPVNET